MPVLGDYKQFIARKSQLAGNAGFEPNWIPDWLFDFQQALVRWAVEKGRCAIFADCGLGKTAMQLVWAENIIRHTNKPVLILTPLAVGAQTVDEANRFGITAKRTRDGKITNEACVWVTNYEQLHKYDSKMFAGVVCDESSCMKDFKTQRKKIVTEFLREMSYRLFCTATAAPNDYWELGTTSEALGYLGFRDMITCFYKQDLDKEQKGWGRTKYRFKGHAEKPFWSYICSFSRSLRRPSDMGFDDTRFKLPPLIEHEIVVETAKPRAGRLFTMPALDMREERAERRHSLVERCERMADLTNAIDAPSALWCELNPEGDLLEKLTKDCVQVKGSMPDEAKEEAMLGFSRGQIKRIVLKPKIGAWGMNWQHCHNVGVMPSHSFEQYYQLVRRFYRHGQLNPVHVRLVISEGERGIINSLQRKQKQVDHMFDSLVRHMHDAMELVSEDHFEETEIVPAWL